jgi:DNA polymerase-4
MGLMKAAQLAPDAILLPADFDAYRHYSRLFKAAVREIAPQMEDRGIDEIYLDLTALNPDGSRRRPPRAAAAAGGARRHRAVVLHRRGAQQAARQAVLRPGQARRHHRRRGGRHPRPHLAAAGPAHQRHRPQGRRAARGLGIVTIGELAAADPAWLQDHFGERYGVWLHRAAHGDDERPVVTESEPKSLSRETTFERDLHPRLDKAELSAHFTRLCEQLAADLARKGYVGKTIGLKLRFDNFHTVTRDQTLAAPTGDAAAIRRAAGECARRVPLERRIRLLGVRVAPEPARRHPEHTRHRPRPNSSPEPPPQ